MALLVYTPLINNRVRYVFQHIFENILGVEVAFTISKEIFSAFSHSKFSYAKEALADELHFGQHPIMLGKGFELFNHEKAIVDSYDIPFKVLEGYFDADIFAASFYFLSRYEEYIDRERDPHGRFSAKNSYAYQHGFLEQPLIDVWAYQLAEVLRNHFPDFKYSVRKFQFQPTLDIDRPYYYRTDHLVKRLTKKIFFKLNTDPFDIYDLVDEWDQIYQCKTLYFFLMGHQHEFDVAPVHHSSYHELIKRISEKHQVGIHPSYQSNDNDSDLQEEINLLSKYSTHKIEKSRQHYLKVDIHLTYSKLINAGIKEDYSLAYADAAGFRASTCTPFFWYDLKNDLISELIVHPTAVMDQTLKKYLNLDMVTAQNVIEQLMTNVAAVNGTFISLWHNESIGNFQNWKGWQAVYLKMLEDAQSFNNS